MRNFFVHIIESPSSNELLRNITEGYLLKEGLRIAKIKSSYNLATDKSTFITAIKNRFLGAIGEYGMPPILHISAHGDTKGIQLTDKTFIAWEDLRELLIPINNTLNNLLIVCISSCQGFYGCKMAMRPHSAFPFYGLIGPTEDITLSDTAIAFLSFYYRLFKGSSVPDAIAAMKISSGNDNFDRILATKAQQLWIDEFNKLTPERLKKLIEKYEPK